MRWPTARGRATRPGMAPERVPAQTQEATHARSGVASSGTWQSGVSAAQRIPRIQLARYR